MNSTCGTDDAHHRALGTYCTKMAQGRRELVWWERLPSSAVCSTIIVFPAAKYLWIVFLITMPACSSIGLFCQLYVDMQPLLERYRFINIDAYISGQMSKVLDPVSISRLRHRTREPYVPITTVFISRHHGERVPQNLYYEISRSIFNNDE